MNNENTGINITEKDGEEEGIKHVTFLIEEETYGVGVEKVKEIIGITDITHVPNSIYFMEGVINLRGYVVPVVDMRKKFKMQLKEYDGNTVVIIVEVMDRLIGMIVDSVSDVINIPAASIQSAPHFNADIETEFIKGIGRVDEILVIVLDVDKILSIKDLKTVDDVKLQGLAVNEKQIPIPKDGGESPVANQ